jgi:hypothetical protein
MHDLVLKGFFEINHIFYLVCLTVFIEIKMIDIMQLPYNYYYGISGDRLSVNGLVFGRKAIG